MPNNYVFNRKPDLKDMVKYVITELCWMSYNFSLNFYSMDEPSPCSGKRCTHLYDLSYVTGCTWIEIFTATRKFRIESETCQSILLATPHSNYHRTRNIRVPLPKFNTNVTPVEMKLPRGWQNSFTFLSLFSPSRFLSSLCFFPFVVIAFPCPSRLDVPHCHREGINHPLGGWLKRRNVLLLDETVYRRCNTPFQTVFDKRLARWYTVAAISRKKLLDFHCYPWQCHCGDVKTWRRFKWSGSRVLFPRCLLRNDMNELGIMHRLEKVVVLVLCFVE